MNELELADYNKGISYEDGKIYWELNKGYTSKLMNNLYSHGWKVVKSGQLRQLKDSKGHTVTTGLTWPELLKNTAIVMR